jgi:hypothetical protein
LIGAEEGRFSLSYSAGLEVEKKFSNWGFKTSLSIDRKRESSSMTYPVDYYQTIYITVDVSIDAYYINFPLYVNYSFGKKKNFYVEAGV